MFSTLTIVGIGLIGGSLGRAVRKRGLAKRVIGTARKPATLKAAMKIGAADETTSDVVAAILDADAVILCTPVETIAETVRSMLLELKPDVFLTDAGSTKAVLVKEVEQSLKKFRPDVRFIGSHPMAGKEKSGPEHADADLFQDRVTILTPTARTSPEALEAATAFWSALGSRIVCLSPDEHDAAVAAISHVPHAVASALAADTPEEFLPLVAGGWLDSTRIASGDPELWRQILTQNRRHVLKRLDRFAKVLTSLRDALEAENDAQLLKILQAGKRTRDAVGS